MKASTSQNDAPATRQLLLRWAALHYQQPVRTLDQLKGLCDSALADEVSTLEAAIYSQSDEAWTRGRRYTERYETSPNVGQPNRPITDPSTPLRKLVVSDCVLTSTFVGPRCEGFQ